jgi:hypothetical protein
VGALGLQMAFVSLVGAAIAFREGASALAPLFDYGAVGAVYGGTLLLAAAHAVFFSGRFPKALIPFARSAALALGALTSLMSMHLLVSSISDAIEFPRLVYRSLGGLIHGLLLSEVVLAPFEIPDAKTSPTRWLQRLTVGLSGVVIVGVYVAFFKLMSPGFEWGNGTEESLPSPETFSAIELPAPVGEVDMVVEDRSGRLVGDSPVYLRIQRRFDFGTKLFTSDNVPMVLTSSSSYFYRASPPSGAVIPRGDWVYASRRSPETLVSEITLETTGCLGSCPIYSLTLRRDGSIVYEGKGYVRRKGIIRSRLARSDFLRLELLLFKHGYFQLAQHYDREVTCNPSVITSAVIGGRRKRIRNYADSGPFALWTIENAIEGLAKKSGLNL